MKIFIVILLIAFTTTVYSQNKLFGVYERKWSAYSTLTLSPDSTFKEKYISFSCGMFASVFKDSVFTGTWKVNKNILDLTYNPTGHDKSWDISKFLIDTFVNQLIQVRLKDASALDYIKTKDFDSNGNVTWELNPADIISSFENLPYTEEQSKRNKKPSKRDRLVILLQFWLRDHRQYTIESTEDYKLGDIIYASPYSLVKQVYFVGQLKYRLANPGDTSIVNQKKAGLKALITAYSNEWYKKYKSKSMEDFVAMDANGKLDEYIRKKLQ